MLFDSVSEGYLGIDENSMEMLRMVPWDVRDWFLALDIGKIWQLQNF